MLLDSNNLKLNPVDNEDMKNIILKEGEKILEKENLTLFQRLFWQQQAEAAGKSDPRAMRWHPFMIRCRVVSSPSGINYFLGLIKYIF